MFRLVFATVLPALIVDFLHHLIVARLAKMAGAILERDFEKIAPAIFARRATIR